MILGRKLRVEWEEIPENREKLALIRQKNRSNSTVPPTQDENSPIPKEQIDNQLEDKNKPYGTIELQASNNANDRILNPSQHPTLSDGKLKHQLPPEMTMVSNKPLNQIHRRSKLEKWLPGNVGPKEPKNCGKAPNITSESVHEAAKSVSCSQDPSCDRNLQLAGSPLSSMRYNGSKPSQALEWPTVSGTPEDFKQLNHQ
ncbi:unnamed protein product, partial [Mesorhabditis spiculigera]